MKILFHPDAVDELNDAIEYYEDFEQGLGVQFIYEIDKSIQLLESHPDA
jgi:ParE toxin of type II toxin-antitoxin system, parDE